jgi:predicted TIM-barrel fold metal-dependent hydrolase
MGPKFDHHVHVLSEAARSWVTKVDSSRTIPPLSFEQLYSALDEDGVERAAVLSVAYFFACPLFGAPTDRQLLMAENDWVGDEGAKHPERLSSFFSVNPIDDSSLDEVARCASNGSFVGVKLHLANSGVDLRDRGHLERLASTLQLANDNRLAVVVHLRTVRADYGAVDANAFIEHCLPFAPDVPVQVAHMAGWGGYDAATDAALGAFVSRLVSDESLNERVYFDVSAVVRELGDSNESWPPDARYARIASRLRTLRSDRILFGTDWPVYTAAKYAADFQASVPLDESELALILANRAPWI